MSTLPNHSFPLNRHLEVEFGPAADYYEACERAATLYEELGCFLAKRIVPREDITAIHHDVRRLVELRMQHAGVLHSRQPQRFDDGIMDLIAAGRQHGAVMYDACRRLYPVHRLSVSERLSYLAKRLIPTDLLIASDLKSVRIDFPGEDKYLHGWHQDYPFIMDSEDALVVWIPFHSVDEKTGTVQAAVGSHTMGLQSVRWETSADAQNNKQRALRMADETIVADFPWLTVQAEPGDAFIFHTLMLHRSLPNRDARPRWTAQLRFGNFAHPLAVQRDWPGSMRDGHSFPQQHGQYVINASTKEGSPMKSRDRQSQSHSDRTQFGAIAELFESEPIDLIEKIEGFGKYASRQAIGKFLTKYEIFRRILNVNGSIIECGVLHGAGLLTWAKLSSLLEPANHPRKVVGFDTFSGFPHVHQQDTATGSFQEIRTGGLCGSTVDNVAQAVRVYDLNRPISHIPKVELVAGDLCQTAAAYLEKNPHLVVSLLYLDVDLYEPTKAALEVFVPRMPKGAIIAFDELNASIFPGETAAVHEVLGLNQLRIERFPFDSYVSFAVL